MRFAVVSDIHGNLPALEAVVADFGRRGVDAVVNLGDSLSGPLLPRETAQFLMAQEDWIQLAGNHERQILDERGACGRSDVYARTQLGPSERAWIATLTPNHRIAEDVFACHATPTTDMVYLLETIEPTHLRVATNDEIEARLEGEGAALVLCGHSHTPRSVRTARGQWIVNPGSVGLPGFLACGPTPHRVQNASPDARYAIVERCEAGVSAGSGRGWSASLISVPYDHRSMADLAGRRGRPEWQRALATGYV